MIVLPAGQFSQVEGRLESIRPAEAGLMQLSCKVKGYILSFSNLCTANQCQELNDSGDIN